MSPPLSKRNAKRVVVIGGGFAGSAVVKMLDRMPRFDVILVDTKEYFEYTPGMIQALCDPTQSKQFRIDYSDILKNGKLVLGLCTQVTDSNIVANSMRIPYDYLVITTGSSYTSQIKGRNISTLYRAKKIMSEFADLENAKNVLVIGGGLVGVELSCQIASKFPEKVVTLVDANSSVLKRLPIKAQNTALQILKKHNVKVILKERVTSFDLYKRVFITEKGGRYSCDKVYIATGPQPNSLFLQQDHPDWLTDEKLIKVNRCLQVVGKTNIFAGGDVCNLPVEKLALASLQHGISIARNICRIEKGKIPVEMGKKGLAKMQHPPKAQIVSLYDEALCVLWGRYSLISKGWHDFKIRYQFEVMKMIQGSLKFDSDLGRTPSILPPLQQTSRPNSTLTLSTESSLDEEDYHRDSISFKNRKSVSMFIKTTSPNTSVMTKENIDVNIRRVRSIS